MSVSVPRNPTSASGVRLLLVALALAAAANLVADVPFYFGAYVAALGSWYSSETYQQYAPLLNLAVPALVGVIGVVGIVQLEKGRNWTRNGPRDPTRVAFYVGGAAAALLFLTGLVLGFWYHPPATLWNPVRMTLRFVLVLAAGIYLLGTAARLDPGSWIALGKIALVFGTFAAAVRMGVAIVNGLFQVSGTGAQLAAALSLAAFVIAMLSLFVWIAVYDHIRRRFPPEAIKRGNAVVRNGRTRQSG